MARWLPSASTVSGDVDGLFLFMVALTAVVSLGIIIVIVFFVIRYHKSREPDRRDIPASNLWLEITWSQTPLLVSIFIFIWATRIYVRMYAPAEGGKAGFGRDIYVVGTQWMWKIQHPQGPREINSLHVPVGVPIRLVMTSEDVIHSFYVPAFRIKKDVLPGRYTSFHFQATKTGSYHLFCAEFCGTMHSGMIGTVEVMAPEVFQRWLAAGGTQSGAGEGGTPEARGARLFQSLGCSGCHGAAGTIRAPDLAGVFGRPVPLQGGGTALADEAYIRESIYFPQRKIAAGYQPVMPSFQGVAGEEDVMALIAYIRSLAASGEEGAR